MVLNVSVQALSWFALWGTALHGWCAKKSGTDLLIHPAFDNLFNKTGSGALRPRRGVEQRSTSLFSPC